MASAINLAGTRSTVTAGSPPNSFPAISPSRPQPLLINYSPPSPPCVLPPIYQYGYCYRGPSSCHSRAIPTPSSPTAFEVSQSSPSQTNPSSNGSSVFLVGTATKKPIKAGRRSKYTTSEDLILVQEVAASKAHVAPHDETVGRFGLVADQCNGNLSFPHTITWKRAQDRFKRIIDDFEARDQRERALSGTGGEIGELDELPADLLQARKDFLEEKNASSDALKKEEEQKLEAGRKIIIEALQNKKKRGSYETNDEEGPSKTRRRLPGDTTDGMIALSSALKESDMAKYEVEKERIVLEKQHHEQEVLDRVADPAQCQEEREIRRQEAQV